MISKLAICPYYKHEDSQVIYCDGVQEGSVLHVAFSNRGDALEFKKCRCRSEYRRCSVYQMLERIYGNE